MPKVCCVSITNQRHNCLYILAFSKRKNAKIKEKNNHKYEVSFLYQHFRTFIWKIENAIFKDVTMNHDKYATRFYHHHPVALFIQIPGAFILALLMLCPRQGLTSCLLSGVIISSVNTALIYTARQCNIIFVFTFLQNYFISPYLEIIKQYIAVNCKVYCFIAQ